MRPLAGSARPPARCTFATRSSGSAVSQARASPPKLWALAHRLWRSSSSGTSAASTMARVKLVSS